MIKLNELLPSSNEWLVKKGYASCTLEDGEPVFRLTTAGHNYLTRITTGEGHAMGSHNNSKRKTPE